MIRLKNVKSNPQNTGNMPSILCNIVEIGRGTFGRVYKAELANTGLVALKSFVDEYSNIEEDELKRIDEEFVNELELLHEVDCHQNVNHILGITKVYRSYILVLEYANEGNLRDYLINKFTSLEWKDKIQMALDITCGLKFLHSKGIIHRDLHSKNILVNNGKLSIADLGLSKKLAEAATNSIANKMGIIEYIEPQCIKSDKYKKNKKSDIYSLGVLLWEISSGKCPFSDRSRDILAYHISYNNLREKPIGGTPQKYQQLYQECWDSEPELRPDIEKVYETLSQLKTEDFSSLPYSQSNINEIKNSNIDYNDDLNDLNISDIVNSRRESSHKPNFRDEALKYFDGKSGIVYKAIWLNNNEDKEVTLKCYKNLNEDSNEFLNEFKFHGSCLDSSNIINLYGFTKNPDTLKYMGIMDYANKDKEDEDRIYISDFELCQPVKSFLKKDEIFGLTPFMAPEVLRSKPFTQASDIYSFSMIMWEFTSGVPPFVGREYDFQLSISICKGERPEIVENTPQCYIDLMKKCWNEDQLKRPSSKEVLNIIEEWIILPDKTKAEDIDEELKCNIMEFINVPIGEISKGCQKFGYNRS
ncbi:kinase-like domain-containing protein [Rhizophagus irregularis DAOM 181602=DAOM 197198]|nr:kinase-like domain-containing protein [Rhizophagus irregularis DAOM 181602=DAOM 197198]